MAWETPEFLIVAKRPMQEAPLGAGLLDGLPNQ